MNKTTLTLVVLAVLALAGCGGNGASGNGSASVNFADVPMSTNEINALQPGDQAYVMVEREDGIKFHRVTLGQRYTAGADDYLTFRDTERRFGFGDSGSPVLLVSNGKTIGALSGSFGGDNVLITPIDRMLESVGRRPSAPSGFNGQVAWFATGLSEQTRQRFRDAGIPISGFDLSNAASRATTRGPSALQAGRSLAVVPFDGPLVSIFAIGSATHAPNMYELLAFGHSLNYDGQPFYSMPVRAARVVQFVNDPVWGSFKLAVPVGGDEGAISQDRAAGVLVDRSRSASLIEIVVNANSETTTHRVSRLDGESMNETFFANGLSQVGVAMLDNGSPGYRHTLVTVTHHDNSTSFYDLGFVDWDWYFGGFYVWEAIRAEYGSAKKVEVTL
jgi:hypothetical protein